MKLRITVGAIIVLCFVAGAGVYASEQNNGGRGTVTGMVQFFSQDIKYLQNEIGNLMAECGKELNE